MAAKKDTSAAVPAGSDKKKALETAMQQIEKMYGKGSIMRYGENAETNVEAIPTGSLALDLALGIGGVPRGRIIEIYGPESSGKRTIWAAHSGPGPEAGRRGGLCGCRARPGPHLCPGAGGSDRGYAHLPAGHRRAGPGDHRGPGPLRCHRRGGGGLRGCPGAPGGDRGRDGRQLRGPARPADEPGSAQAHRRHRQNQQHRHLHQPAAGEGGRDVSNTQRGRRCT